MNKFSGERKLAKGLFLIGHGTKSEVGVSQFRETVELISNMRPNVTVESGFIEFAKPDLDTGIDTLIEQGVEDVMVIPLVLLGAGHLKDDGPEAIRRARERHPKISFHYAREIGAHPLILDEIESKIKIFEKEWDEHTGVLLVGRGSSDPDSNSELFKIARLLSDSRNLPSEIVPAFISLATPTVTQGLDRLLKLGISSIIVAPYFLFTGILLDRIYTEAATWSKRSLVNISLAKEIGPSRRVSEIAWERFDEASEDLSHMNCDMCIYRYPIPGYQGKVGVSPKIVDKLY